MERALLMAHKALKKDEVPVGAIIVDRTGQVLAKAHNRTKLLVDPTAHAEILAIREAAKISGSAHLSGCTLVVTAEPCAMCAGAILSSRISKVVFGAWEPKFGAAGSVYDLLRDGRLPQPIPEVVGGVQEAESASLLQLFFSNKRY